MFLVTEKLQFPVCPTKEPERLCKRIPQDTPYLENHVKHHQQAIPAWIFPNNVGRSEVEEVGSCFRADGMDQHFLSNAGGSRQQQGFHQRSVLMDGLGTCKKS